VQPGPLESGQEASLPAWALRQVMKQAGIDRIPSNDFSLYDHGVFPPEQIWVNPECGLKTRAWPEVGAALKNIVEAARTVRRKLRRG
jgi:hypothetical protein